MPHRPGPSPLASPRTATLALLLACALWGCSFTWASAAGKAVNAALGAGDHAPVGPIWLTACRFLLAGLLWLLLFPAARRGWSWISLRRGALLGSLLGVATFTQVLGLDRTAESTNAFLTSLTILFVPLLSAVVLRRPPRAVMWAGIALAIVGIALLTNASGNRAFGLGEALGVACALLFSIHILLVNAVVPRDNVWRMAGAQFLIGGLTCAAVCLSVPHGPRASQPYMLATLCRDPAIVTNLALLTLLPGFLAFGLLMFFQPRLDASRATLIYLTEPVFAAVFAYIIRGSAARMTPTAVAGAALILFANALVEWVSARRPISTVRPQQALSVP